MDWMVLNKWKEQTIELKKNVSSVEGVLDVDLHYLFLRHVKQEVERLSCCLVNTNEGLKQEQNVINRRMWIVRVHEIV